MVRMFKRKRSVLVVSPTGSGKTVIAVRFLKKYGKDRVLWVAHRWELLDQAHRELLQAGIAETDIGFFTSSRKRNVDARILITSVGMWRRREVPPGIKWVVIDEAHRSAAKGYREILEEVPRAKLVGLTATPIRLDASPLGDIFESLLVAATPSELIVAKWLPKPRCFGIDRGKAKLIVKASGAGSGDWTSEAAARGMKTMYGDIVAEVQRLAHGLQTLVFAATRDYGRRLLKRFARARLAAEYLDGDTPTEERATIIDRLRTGKTQVVVNVDVLSEGFDCPPVKCVVLARPTKSLTRLLQQCGRGSRLYEGQRPIIIDSAGNFTRFPLPTFDYEWSLTENGPRAATVNGEAPNKACVVCEEQIPIGCRECPECGNEQPLSEREISEQEARLVELRETEAEKAAALRRIRKIAKEKGAGEDWVEKVLAEMFRAA